MATRYMPRSAWTSSSRGGAQLTGTKLEGTADHWPGTSQDEIGVETEAQTANRLRGYRNFHLSRNWADIGYNFAGDQAGRVWDLRGLGRVGAHCASPSNPDANHEWMGFLFIIGDQEEPSPALIRAFQDWRYDVFLERWPGRTRLTGHGRAPGVPGAQTSCPGPFAAALITDGTLAKKPGTTPPQEDDMEATDDIQLSPSMTSALGGHEELSVGSLLGYGGAGGFKYLNDRVGLLTAQAKSLTELAAIKAAVGGQVDEEALAQQIAALLVPHVVAAVGEAGGLTPEQVEEAAEKALRDVLREGVEAT